MVILSQAGHYFICDIFLLKVILNWPLMLSSFSYLDIQSQIFDLSIPREEIDLPLQKTWTVLRGFYYEE